MSALLLFVGLASVSQSALTGFLKIPDIPGESKAADHEGEIDIHGISWGVKTSATTVDGERGRGRAEASDITLLKSTDAASVHLFLAAAQGRFIPEITFTATRQNDSGKPQVYLEITLSDCHVTSFEVMGLDTPNELATEQVSLSYEKIRIHYTVQADDHSAGDEHEIEFDLAGGV